MYSIFVHMFTPITIYPHILPGVVHIFVWFFACGMEFLYMEAENWRRTGKQERNKKN